LKDCYFKLKNDWGIKMKLIKFTSVFVVALMALENGVVIGNASAYDTNRDITQELTNDISSSATDSKEDTSQSPYKEEGSTELSEQKGVPTIEGSVFGGQSEVQVGDFVYHINNLSGTASWVSYDTSAVNSNLIVPETIQVAGESYIVTTVGDGTTPVLIDQEFESIKLPNTIVEIRYYSFINMKINELVLPRSLKTLGGAFGANNEGASGAQIKKLVIPDTIESIGAYAFRDVKLDSIEFSNAAGELISLDESGNLLVPEGVKLIGDEAFSGCGLTNGIKLPESLQYLGESAFANNKLSWIQLPNHFTTTNSGFMLMNYALDIDTVLNINSQIKELSDFSFNLNNSEIVHIPNNIEKIGDMVFGSFDINHQTLKEVVVTNSVLTFGVGVFSNQKLDYLTTPIGQAQIIENRLSSDTMYGVVNSTILREDDKDKYGVDTRENNLVKEGSSLTFSVVSRNKFVWNLVGSSWEPYVPEVKWFKEGNILEGENKQTLNLNNISEKDSGTYYAKIDGNKLADLTVSLKTDAKIVTVKYVDGEGNPLAESDELSGEIGLPYESTAKSISGWTLRDTPENAKGNFSKESQTVTYVYEKAKSALAIADYVDGGDLSVPASLTQETPINVKESPSSNIIQAMKTDFSKEQDLPQTGELNNAYLLIIGSILSSIVLLILFPKITKNNKY
jgi:LPXTG-motif cell wall-anchored protein